MDKVNPFSALLTLFSLTLFSALFIAFEGEYEAVFLTNPGKHL